MQVICNWLSCSCWLFWHFLQGSASASDGEAPLLVIWGVWSTSLHFHYSQIHSDWKQHRMVKLHFWRSGENGGPLFISITSRFTLTLNSICWWSSTSGDLGSMEYLPSFPLLPDPLWLETTSDGEAPLLEIWEMWSTSLHFHYSQIHSHSKHHRMVKFHFWKSGEYGVPPFISIISRITLKQSGSTSEVACVLWYIKPPRLFNAKIYINIYICKLLVKSNYQ